VSGSWCSPVVLAGRGGAGLRLARTACERRGSADRHADVGGSGPQVGCAQAGAPDLMRRAVLGTAVRSRGSCLVSAVLGRVLGLAGAVAPIGDRPRGRRHTGQSCISAHRIPASSRAAATTATSVMCLGRSSCRKAAQSQLGRPGAGQDIGPTCCWRSRRAPAMRGDDDRTRPTRPAGTADARCRLSFGGQLGGDLATPPPSGARPSVTRAGGWLAGRGRRRARGRQPEPRQVTRSLPWASAVAGCCVPARVMAGCLLWWRHRRWAVLGSSWAGGRRSTDYVAAALKRPNRTMAGSWGRSA
jgi:hypothetical protein